MFRRIVQHLLIATLVFLLLFTLSCARHWAIIMEYCKNTSAALAETLAVILIQITGIIFMIRAVFQRRR